MSNARGNTDPVDQIVGLLDEIGEALTEVQAVAQRMKEDADDDPDV